MFVLCAVIGSIYACIFPFRRCMLRCIRKESYKILNLASLGYLKILVSVVSNMKTARVYASFKYKTGTASQLRDPWIKHKF